MYPRYTMPDTEMFFDPAEWRPTSVGEIAAPDLEDIQALAHNLAVQTYTLRRYPYCPVFWLDRAKTFASLLYPELAINDAYKAELLCKTINAQIDKTPCMRLGYNCGFWMEHAGYAHEDDYRSLVERSQATIGHAARIQREQLSDWKLGFESGEWRPQRYPWMDEKDLRRSDDLIDLINNDFRAEQKTGSEHSYCELRRHAFGESPTNPAVSSDVLGVFALKDIPRDKTIIYESTRLFGCSGPGHDSFIGSDDYKYYCGDPLHPNIPDDEYDQDLRWIRDVIPKMNAPGTILAARMLLTVIQDQGIYQSPLQHDLIARLTPTYNRSEPEVLLLDSHIRVPNQVLQQLGVDIFANEHWEGWILFTIHARRCNNAWSNNMHTGIHPLFTLLNHSCEPNAAWSTHADEPTKMEVTASREIREGEQIFICYDQFMEYKKVRARRETLMAWLNGYCQCTRCVREEAAGGMDIEEEEKPEWDVKVCPVFPEDGLPIKPH